MGIEANRKQIWRINERTNKVAEMFHVIESKFVNRKEVLVL